MKRTSSILETAPFIVRGICARIPTSPRPARPSAAAVERQQLAEDLVVGDVCGPTVSSCRGGVKGPVARLDEPASFQGYYRVVGNIASRQDVEIVQRPPRAMRLPAVAFDVPIPWLQMNQADPAFRQLRRRSPAVLGACPGCVNRQAAGAALFQLSRWATLTGAARTARASSPLRPPDPAPGAVARAAGGPAPAQALQLGRTQSDRRSRHPRG